MDDNFLRSCVREMSNAQDGHIYVKSYKGSENNKSMVWKLPVSSIQNVGHARLDRMLSKDFGLRIPQEEQEEINKNVKPSLRSTLFGGVYVFLQNTDDGKSQSYPLPENSLGLMQDMLECCDSDMPMRNTKSAGSKTTGGADVLTPAFYIEKSYASVIATRFRTLIASGVSATVLAIAAAIYYKFYSE